ncbi:hypothetical protein J4455_00030 [Candidatus Woesearchaeota archaeon]|nr:hypothetical protein [Candidatus Woesearchaeota archaeon]
MVKFNLIGILVFLFLVWAFSLKLSSIFVNLEYAFLSALVIIIIIDVIIYNYLSF